MRHLGAPGPGALESLLQGLPGAVAYWDAGTRNRLADDEYRAWFGLRPDQVGRVRLAELLALGRCAEEEQYVAAALAGKVQQAERTVTDAAGRVRHLRVTYIPDLAGTEVRGFFVHLADVTEQVLDERRHEQSVRQYRALARGLPGGFVVLFDTDLRFLVADGEELAVFGYRPEELEGRTLHEALPAELVAELEPRYRAALAGRTVTWERRLGARTFRLTAGPAAADDGLVSTATVIATDVTEERRNERIWAALHEIATEVARQTGPDEVAERVTLTLQDVFAVESAAVVRFTGRRSGRILAVAPAGLVETGEEIDLDPGDVSAVTRVLATGRAEFVRYSAEDGPVSRALTSSGLVVGAAAPIHRRGALWGAIALGSRRPDGLDPEVLDRLATFAELVELAIGNAEAWAALTQEALTDPLTGLPNRRAFEERLAVEVARAQRDGSALSVVLLDLDRFKSVNDRHGHPTGDEVLREFAERLRAVSREGDVVARIGGEEFAWLLPGGDGGTAVAAAERLRRRVAARDFGHAGRLSVSAGVCALADAGPNRRAGRRRGPRAVRGEEGRAQLRLPLPPARVSPPPAGPDRVVAADVVRRRARPSTLDRPGARRRLSPSGESRPRDFGRADRI